MGVALGYAAVALSASAIGSQSSGQLLTLQTPPAWGPDRPRERRTSLEELARNTLGRVREELQMPWTTEAGKELRAPVLLEKQS